MTPKEKAEDLFRKFDLMGRFVADPERIVPKEAYMLAKACARVAVDELLDFYKRYDGGIDSDEYGEQVNYWTEVRAEILGL